MSDIKTAPFKTFSFKYQLFNLFSAFIFLKFIQSSSKCTKYLNNWFKINNF